MVLALLVAVAALATLARVLRVAYPILLVLGGLALSFLPGLPDVQIPADVIFLLFVPPPWYISPPSPRRGVSCGPTCGPSVFWQSAWFS